MKSAEEIDLDYAHAMQQARAVEDAAGQVQRLAQADLGNCLHLVQAGWRGEDARRFLQLGADIGADSRRTALEMNRLAAQIRAAAARTREADLRALHQLIRHLLHIRVIDALGGEL